MMHSTDWTQTLGRVVPGLPLVRNGLDFPETNIEIVSHLLPVQDKVVLGIRTTPCFSEAWDPAECKDVGVLLEGTFPRSFQGHSFGWRNTVS